ncbi:MAG: hypothetical protein ACRD5E_10460 [Nitrososphaeraceae archaeon]
MSEIKQIEDIKQQFTLNIHTEMRNKAIDALAAYGNNGIDAINDLMRITVNDEVKIHGLETIKKIKESMKK